MYQAYLKNTTRPQYEAETKEGLHFQILEAFETRHDCPAVLKLSKDGNLLSETEISIFNDRLRIDFEAACEEARSWGQHTWHGGY